MELSRAEWTARADAHTARVGRWVEPYLERRRRGEGHPVYDFMFTYYSYSPAALRRWHPGYGVRLLDAPEYAHQRGYREGEVIFVHLRERARLLRQTHTLLTAIASRPPTLGCFGLHEWAMVYRADRPRHAWPLRLGATGTDTVVQRHRVACSHFDAYRFFTEPARALNTLRPGRDNRVDFEQPGCLHVSMDTYKHAFRLSPLICSELVADAFELAWEIRVWDMRASPYDFSGLGLEPVRIETVAGKQEYAEAQRGFAARAEPIRQRLIDDCVRLLDTCRD